MKLASRERCVDAIAPFAPFAPFAPPHPRCHHTPACPTPQPIETKR
ncbi:hypothetical protein [Microcoleus vaginatus]